MEDNYFKYIYDKYILYHNSNNILDDNDIVIIFNKYKSNIYIKQLYELFIKHPELINPISGDKITLEEYFNIYIKNKIRIIYNIQNDEPIIKQFIEEINKKNKYKKKYIPSAIKKIVWNTYIGEEKGKSKCLCCKTTEIIQISFHCGHIISEKNGGELNVSNLRPICQNCNSSMGQKNMMEFMELFK